MCVNKQPKLSILIPTYNREEFVKDAIDSVLNQSFEDFEIICSDNNSTDETQNILLEYAKKDNRIRVLINEENLGPVPNWKNCLDNATGEYVHWLWSDDWIEPDFYVDAFKLMDKDGTSILTTWNYRADNVKNLDDKYISWQFSFPIISGEIAAHKILRISKELPVSPAAYIIPRVDVINNFYMDIPSLGILNPVKKGVGVDSLMVLGSLLNHTNLSVLQKPSVNFRKHENISTKLSQDGSLSKMYMISHLWFISKFKIKLDFWTYIRIFNKVRVIFGLGGMLINIKYFLSIMLFNLSLKDMFKINDGFNSKKSRTD